MAPTISYKIFETNYSFHVKWRTTGKGLIAVFQDFFASLNKILIFAGGMGTGLSFYEDETLSYIS